MAYQDVWRWLGHKPWFAWTAARLAPLDAAILKKTGGRFGLLGNYGLPQCLVTTTGRKSGQPRTVTLLYGRFGGSAEADTGGGEEILLVGSNFGQKHHPAWAYNLEANPQATIQIGEEVTEMTARMVTDPEERERAFRTMYEIWPAYHAYRGRAGREIKIFALTPTIAAQ